MAEAIPVRRWEKNPSPVPSSDVFAVGTGASGSFDLSGGRDELSQHVEPLVVDVFFFEFSNRLPAAAAQLGDGDILLFGIPFSGTHIVKNGNSERKRK